MTAPPVKPWIEAIALHPDATRGQKKDGKPHVTVVHNGIKIHDNAEMRFDARVGGLHFRDHGNAVQFRSIWVVPLAGE